MSLLMVVTNTGELAATITEVSVSPLTLGIDENGPDRTCYADIIKAVPVTTPNEGIAEVILRARSRPIVALLDLPASCLRIGQVLGVEVKFTYTDPLNNVYTQTEELLANVERKSPPVK